LSIDQWKRDEVLTAEVVLDPEMEEIEEELNVIQGDVCHQGQEVDHKIN